MYYDTEDLKISIMSELNINVGTSSEELIEHNILSCLKDKKYNLTSDSEIIYRERYSGKEHNIFEIKKEDFDEIYQDIINNWEW